jgi:hypothetical protein
MRYGLFDHLHRMSQALFEAARLFEFYRLPEVFAGHARDDFLRFIQRRIRRRRGKFDLGPSLIAAATNLSPVDIHSGVLSKCPFTHLSADPY